ncbi:hypothetical protein PMAYCL1PPCAC_19996, partial [Pristionchus mayeri]
KRLLEHLSSDLEGCPNAKQLRLEVDSMGRLHIVRLPTPKPRDMDTFSALETLPKELAMRIFEHVPESVLALRATSRTMSAFADQFAMEPSLKFPIGRLDISSRGENHILIEFAVARHKAKLFGLRYLHGGVDRRIKHAEHFNRFLMLWQLDSTGAEQSIKDLIRSLNGECAIERVSLRCDESMMSIAPGLLEGIHITQLRVLLVDSLSDEVADHILSICDDVDDLRLAVGHVSVADPAKLLINLSSRIRSLDLCQGRVCPFMRDSAYLFGLIDVDWSVTFLSMFSKRLEKLVIDNSPYPDYLSLQSADAMREQLPLLRKKALLLVSCHAYKDHLKYTVDDHIIEVGQANAHSSRLLRIVHESRWHEAHRTIV